MSQIYKAGVSGTPSVPTSFTTDVIDAGIAAVPAAGGSVTPVTNTLRVSGDNGISTVETPGVPGNMTVRFIRAEGTTVNDQTVAILTQATNTDSTFTSQIIVAGFADNNDSVGAYGSVVINNTAGVARVVDSVDLIINKDASLDDSNVTVTVSGASFEVNCVGVLGRTISWIVVLPGIASSP